MAPSARLCLGKGARCSCLVKSIRPSKDVAAALVDPKPGRCIDDLIAISLDVTTRGGKTCVFIFLRSSTITIPGLLHAAEQWIKVEEQGPPDQLWEDAAPSEAPAAAVYIDERGEENCRLCLQRTELGGDIALIRNMGFEVDDINKPTPENVPAGEAPPVNGGNSWKGRSLKALVQLKKVGMFAWAVIKKHRYWPAFVPGEAINREFDNA